MTDNRTPPPPAAPPPDGQQVSAPPRAEPISLAPAGAPLSARSTAAWGMVPPESPEALPTTGEWGSEDPPQPVITRRPVRAPAPLQSMPADLSQRHAKAGNLLDPELLDSALLDSALLDPDLLEPAFDDALLGELAPPVRPMGRPFTAPEPPAALGSLVLLPPPAVPVDVERSTDPERPSAPAHHTPRERLSPAEHPSRARPTAPTPTAGRPRRAKGPTDARIVQAPRRRWLRVLVVVLVILVLLAAAALLFLRPIAERLVAAKVESVAAARGLQVRWAAVEFGGPRTVRLRDVTVDSPVGQVHAVAIEVRVDWTDIFKPAPAEVLIEQPTGALHLPEPGTSVAQAPAEPAAGEAKARPPIRITGGRFAFSHALGEATLEVHEASYIEGVLEGRVALNASRPLGGPAANTGAMTAQGTFGVRAWRDEAGALNAEVSNPGNNRALVLSHPRHGQVDLTRAAVHDLRLTGGRLHSGRAELSGLRGRLDALSALDTRLELETVTLHLADGAPTQIQLHGGDVRLALLPEVDAQAADSTEIFDEDAPVPPGAEATAGTTSPVVEAKTPSPGRRANPFDPSPLQRRLARLSARALALDLPPVVLSDLRVAIDTTVRGGDRLNLRFDHGHYAAGALTAHGDVRGHEGSAGRFAIHASHAPPEGPRRLGESILAVWLTAAPLDLAVLPREPGRRFVTAGGVVDGTLLVHGDPADELAVVADLSIRDGRLGYPLFEPTPIDGIAGRLHFDGRFAPGHIRVDRFVAGHKDLRVRAHGQYIDAAPKGELVLKAVVDPVACQAALDALPRALLAPYTRVKATGTWAPQVSLTLPFANPNGLRFDIKDLVGQCVFEEMRARLPRIPEIKVGGKMAVRSDVTWLLEPFVFRVTEGVSENAVVEVGPGTDAYVPLGQMPRYVGGAAYLTEEMNFWYGAALSPQLTSKAIATDLAGDRFVYGGSTVTQQLVKNLFLNRDKTLLRKFREAIIAGRVVDAIPKERVLELYLNCIEFGPDLFGIGRASQFYFQKHASQLSIREAIFLAMLKPSPRAGGSFKRRGTEPVFPWWTRRVHQVIDRLLEAGQISAEQAETARHGHLSWTADGTYVPPDPDDPYFEAQPRKRSRSPRRGTRPVAPADDESKEI